MDSSSIICHAIIENKVILAIESYCQFLRKIINTILLRVTTDSNEHAVVLTNMLNRETNYHTVIINYLFYQLENPINKKYLTTCTALSRSIAAATSFSDFQTLLQRNPSVFLPPNFDTLLSNILHVSLRDIQNSFQSLPSNINNRNEKGKNKRGIKFTTFNNWYAVFEAVYNGYTVFNSVTFSHNSIWFQELRLINWLFLYLDNIINNFSDDEDDGNEEMREEKEKEEEEKKNVKVIDELRGQILLIQDRNRSIENTNVQLNIENGTLKQRLTQLELDNAINVKQKVSVLEAEVGNRILEQKLLQVQEVEKLTSNLNTQLSVKQQRIVELEVGNRNLQERWEEQVAELNTRSAQNASLKQEVAELRAKNTENERNVDQLEAKVNDLKAEKKDIVTENEKLQKHIRKLIEGNDNYTEKNLFDELQTQKNKFKLSLDEC